MGFTLLVGGIILTIWGFSNYHWGFGIIGVNGLWTGLVLVIRGWDALRLVEMEYQKAIDVLKRLLAKHPLDTEEKEAIMTAIGLLSWGGLSKSITKARKAKRDKSTEW